MVTDLFVENDKAPKSYIKKIHSEKSEDETFSHGSF